MNCVVEIRRVSITRLIESSAPARPACFSTDRQWAEWLRSAHESGLQVVRRVDHRPSAQRRAGPQQPVQYEMLATRRIPYCDGCLSTHRTLMQAEGRCHPCDPDALNRGPD